jgi:DNA-directed RNA polymerase subunit alpha
MEQNKKLCWLCGGAIKKAVAEKIEKPIEDLNLSTRVRNCLLRYGITTIEELIRLSFDDLLLMRNFGAYCARELNEKVKAFGLQGWEIE